MTQLELARLTINEADKNIAESFEKRMIASSSVAEYKKEQGLPVFDRAREETVIKNSDAYIESDEIRPYHTELQRELIELSKKYQRSILMPDTDKYYEQPQSMDNEEYRFSVNGEYDIIIKPDAINFAGKYFRLARKVMIVTDSGVPREYADIIARQCREAYLHVIPMGESSKTLENVTDICAHMLRESFSRADCIVAVGGGVVGDMSGFAASMYMRGIDYYSVPTTVLSQVDSSVGGKTAVDFNGVKNVLGAFYQPKGVIIDTNTLITLSARNISEGLCEALKTGIIGDSKLFSLFDEDNILKNIDEIVKRSILFKRSIVEIDPKEKGIRRILNFGHTVGHGVEAANEGRLLHGEAVAVGMLFAAGDELKAKLLRIYRRLDLDEIIGKYYSGIPENEKAAVLSAMSHDKKANGEYVSFIVSDKIGSCEIVKKKLSEII